MSFPTISLAGLTAIVTGGTRGIGKGIALELARRGANLAVVYANPGKASTAASTVAEISMLGVEVIAIQADLTEISSSTKIVKATLDGLGTDTIDILVHNAGFADLTATPETTSELYDTVMNTNLRAIIFLTQAALPYIPTGGRIIAISSTAARRPNPAVKLPLYSASKAAVEGLVRAWALEFGHARGITANSVAVGFTETELLQTVPAARLLEMHKLNAAATAAAPRGAQPDDIGQVVAFLASDSSRWVTGSTVSASGGWQLI